MLSIRWELQCTSFPAHRPDVLCAVGRQACKASQGGDYEKLRQHMREASVEAYHRKATIIEEQEANLMQASPHGVPTSGASLDLLL